MNKARKAFKKIEDDQLKQHLIQTCKTVFPEHSGMRAELLENILCKIYKKPKQEIRIFIDNLEKKKEYFMNIQKLLPRMEACQLILLGTSELSK